MIVGARATGVRVPTLPGGRPVRHPQAVEPPLTHAVSRGASTSVTPGSPAWSPLLDALPIGVLLTDLDATILGANEAAARLVGAERNALLGRDAFTHFVAPDQRAHVQRVTDAVRDGQASSCAVEYQLPGPAHAAPRWAHLHVSRTQQDPPRFLCALHDVTARRTAMNALATREEELRHLLDSLGDGVIVGNAAGEVVLVNRAAEDLSGLSADELMTHRFDHEFVRSYAPDGRELGIGELPGQHTLRTGEELTGVPVGHRRPDGRFVWLEQSTRIVRRDATGRPETVSLSLHDVTDRRAAEAELRYRLEVEDLITDISTRFVSVPAEQLPEVIDDGLARLGHFLDVHRAYVLTLGPDGTFTQVHGWAVPGVATCNEQRQGISADDLPWALGEILARRPVVVSDLADLPSEASAAHALWEEQDVTSLLGVPMVSGDELTGLIGVDLVAGRRAWSDLDIRILRVVGETVSNALARRRANLQLREANERLRLANEEMQRANEQLVVAGRAKDEFLSIASHELRTPLTSILGFVETMRVHGDAIAADDQQRFLEVLERQASRLYRLVDDLLQTSRLAVGRIRATPQRVVVADALTELVEDLRLGRGELTVEAPADLAVRADPEHLGRMLANLIENARKYGAPPIVVRADRDGEQGRITVRDHGPGVPDAFVPELFEKFSQASTGTRREATGTGLGLAIVRDLARLNGGDVAYEPAAPGARFSLRLPAV